MSATGASARGNLTIPSFLMGEARANETYSVDDTNGQNQGDNVRGTEHLGLIEGLRPVPVLERMGANVIQATSDLVLPSLPTADASKVDELGTLNNIDGDFSNVKLSPKRFGMRMDLTRQMLRNQPQLDNIIARDMSVAIANEFDQFVIGTNLLVRPTSPMDRSLILTHAKRRRTTISPHTKARSFRNPQAKTSRC